MQAVTNSNVPYTGIPESPPSEKTSKPYLVLPIAVAVVAAWVLLPLVFAITATVAGIFLGLCTLKSSDDDSSSQIPPPGDSSSHGEALIRGLNNGERRVNQYLGTGDAFGSHAALTQATNNIRGLQAAFQSLRVS